MTGLGFVALLFILFFSSASAAADFNGYIKSTALNVRAEPGVKSAIAGILLKYDPVTVTGEKRVGKTRWYSIKASGGYVSGWVAARFVARGEAPAAVQEADIDYGAHETPTLIRGDFQYVGVQVCADCHTESTGAFDKGAFQVWESHFHSQAHKTLQRDYTQQIASRTRGVEDPANDWRCVKCHQAAFGAGPEQTASSYRAEEGVGCEVCHGPGSTYAEEDHGPEIANREAMGFRVLRNLSDRREVCTSCHNTASPTFIGFDLREFSRKIAHWVDKDDAAYYAEYGEESKRRAKLAKAAPKVKAATIPNPTSTIAKSTAKKAAESAAGGAQAAAGAAEAAKATADRAAMAADQAAKEAANKAAKAKAAATKSAAKKADQARAEATALDSKRKQAQAAAAEKADRARADAAEKADLARADAASKAEQAQADAAAALELETRRAEEATAAAASRADQARADAEAEAASAANDARTKAKAAEQASAKAAAAAEARREEAAAQAAAKAKKAKKKAKKKVASADPFAEYLEDVDDTIRMNTDGKKYKKFKFPHRKHATGVFYSDMMCQTCHHTAETGESPQSCNECHDIDGDADEEKAKKRYVHAKGLDFPKDDIEDQISCVSCHKTMNRLLADGDRGGDKAPVKCTECHARNK